MNSIFPARSRKVDSMRTVTVSQITRARTEVWIPAPHLGPFVDVLFRLRADPGDKRARIQRALLANEGVDRCVCCTSALSLEGFSETRTGFVERRALRCGCGVAYLLEERQLA